MKHLRKTWLEEKINDKLEVLPEYENDDLSGPLNTLRFGKAMLLRDLGTLHKYLGNNLDVKKYYSNAAQTYYPYEDKTPPNGWHENKEQYYYRYEGAYIQLNGAICSYLAGEYDRSKLLFSWALENFSPPEITLKFWKPKEEGESTLYGKIYLYEAYILARMKDYQLCLEKATEAHEAFEYFKRRKYKVYKEDRYPSKILMELAKYKLDPTDEQKKEAQNALLSYANACGHDNSSFRSFLYIYDFQEAYPEVFEPVLPN